MRKSIPLFRKDCDGNGEEELAIAPRPARPLLRAKDLRGENSLFQLEEQQCSSEKITSWNRAGRKATCFRGGYPIFYVCADGGILCAGEDCANSKESRNAEPDCRDDRQWVLVGADVNWEDDTLCCDHCGEYSINSVLYEPELEAVLAAIDRGQDTADLDGVLTWTID